MIISEKGMLMRNFFNVPRTCHTHAHLYPLLAFKNMEQEACKALLR